MFRKLGIFIFAIFFLANIYGCLAFFAGAAAGGVGTAAWLSGKLVREVKASFEKTLEAVESALISLRYGLTQETVKKNIAQLRGKHSDGRNIWIDVSRISGGFCRVEIRVGVAGDRQEAQKILDEIMRFL